MKLPSATRRNIYVRSQRAGERVMASVAKFLTTTLRLKVNESKSAVARPEERKFLGFSPEISPRGVGMGFASMLKVVDSNHYREPRSESHGDRV